MDTKISAYDILNWSYNTDINRLLPNVEGENSTEVVVKENKEVPAIVSRLSNRLLQQEVRRQQNIEDTISKTRNLLDADGHDYSKNKISSDWYFKYIAGLQDVSDDDIQLLFASILAGEIRKPGSISVLALNALRDMSKEDAEIFMKVSGYAIMASENNVFIPQCGQFFNIEKDNEDAYYGLKFDDLRVLSELRLISTQTDTAITFNSEEENAWINMKSGNIGIKIQSKSKNIDIPAWLYTRAGVQLYSLLSGLTPHKEFLFDRIINKYRNDNTQIVWGEIDTNVSEMTITKEYK